jgi:type IV pilus assembly protein PilA
MMKLFDRKKKILGNKGFSLVELIIVIAIMAVLIAVLAPQYIKYVEKSRIATDDSFMAELKHNVEVLMADEAIYDQFTSTATTVTWTCTSGTIVATMDDLNDELNDILGGAHPAKSKAYQGDTYVISIAVVGDDLELTEPTTPAV